MWTLWVAALAAEPDWAALAAQPGWEAIATRDSAIGPVAVAKRDIGGMWCLRAEASTEVPADRLTQVLWDVEAAPSWSSNPLRVSEVLVPGDDRMVFWQHLDVPGWTLISDRFWVLAVEARREPAARGFRWQRVEGAAWPQVLARAAAIDAGAMEPPIMWGEWRFEAQDGPTRVVWRGCQDIGGAVPQWLQTWAGGRSLPDAVADLIHAAQAAP